jgi:hypothetical protein
MIGTDDVINAMYISMAETKYATGRCQPMAGSLVIRTREYSLIAQHATERPEMETIR